MTRITLNGSITITVDPQQCIGWRVGDVISTVEPGVRRRWWQFWLPRTRTITVTRTITDIQP